MPQEIYIPDDKPVFSISSAAQLLGISVPTLRMYEKEGLIIPWKSEGNQRVYSKLDLERIQCIRGAINKRKISINGIKTIYSLIPCWQLVDCSKEDRQNCKTYNGDGQPCWTEKHPRTVCDGADCRECVVYKEYSECGNIKNLLKNMMSKA